MTLTKNMEHFFAAHFASKILINVARKSKEIIFTYKFVLYLFAYGINFEFNCILYFYTIL